MANTIRITVGGIKYSISCDENEAYVKSLANELEHKMDILAKSKPFLSTTMVAVMTALEYLDQNKKISLENEQLKLEIKKLAEKSTCERLAKTKEKD